MATIEELKIIIRVIDRYEKKIDALILNLTELEGVAKATEDININVDVRGEHKLDSLIAKMAAIDMLEVGDVNAGVRGRAVAAAESVKSRAVGSMQIATANIQAGIVNLAAAMQGGGGGNLPAVRNAAQGAASAMRKAEESSSIFNLRMEDMHNALAKLVPLLLVFIAALPALITAVVALAAAMVAALAAFGAIAAFGALGFAMGEAGGEMPSMEDFAEILTRIRDSFFEAFAPIAERLLPTFESALSGLDTLFARIAQRGDFLIALRSQFEAFGGFLLDWIPATLENMARMVMAFDDVFAMIGDFFRETSFLEGMTDFFADALPSLVEFAGIVADMTPTIIEMSIGFLRVSNAVVKFLGFIGRIIGLLPITSEQFGILVGVLLTMITVGALLNGKILTGLIQRLVLLGATAIPTTVASLKTMVSVMFTGRTAAFSLSSALLALRGAVIALLAATGIGLLIPIIGTIGSTFLGMSNDVQKATESLRAFNSMGERVSDINPYGAAPPSGEGAALRRGTTGGRGGSTIVVNGNADSRSLDRAVARVNYANYRSTFRP